MKVILATGLPELDELIERKINANFLGAALYRESVVDIVERKSPDVIVLSELLEGVMEIRSLVLTLRTRAPETRIIFILKDENPNLKAFLFEWMVFDVFTGSLTMPDLQDSLNNPKSFRDVAKEMEILKKFNKKPEFIDDEDPLSNNPRTIDSQGYSVLNNKTLENSELYRQIVSFWSVQDQSGKTFSITNTALSLANRRDLKILLLDFNIDNPNVNLYYSFVDPDRNLGALVDDLLLEDEISKDTFENYLITHPVYENLKILPGYILKMKRQDEDFMIETFKLILQIATELNFSTILIDTKAGLSPLNKEILSSSNKILLHINENPGSLNSIYRFFDTQFGPFVSSFIDKNKLLPVINNYHPETLINFKKAIHAYLELPVIASFPYSDSVRLSVQKATPLLSKKINDEVYLGFIKISNAIHENSFQEPVVKTIVSQKDTNQTNTQHSTNNHLDNVTSKMKNIFNKNKDKK